MLSPVCHKLCGMGNSLFFLPLSVTVYRAGLTIQACIQICMES